MNDKVNSEQSTPIGYNVPSLCDVAKFGNEFFRLPINVMRTVNVNLPQNLQ